MAFSALDDPARQPTPADLRRVLAAAAPLWRRIISHAAESCPPITELWNHGGARGGWSLRLKRGDRVLLYMTPQASCIQVGFVLGEKAARSAHAVGLPEPVLDLIDKAPRYAEGRGIRFPVATDADLSVVKHLLALKAGVAAAPADRATSTRAARRRP